MVVDVTRVSGQGGADTQLQVLIRAVEDLGREKTLIRAASRQREAAADLEGDLALPGGNGVYEPPGRGWPGGWLRLVARRGGPSEGLLYRGRSRAHIRQGRVSARLRPGLFVKVRIQVVCAVAPVEIDRQDLQDRGALRLKRRVEVWAGQDVVEVVVQHV